MEMTDYRNELCSEHCRLSRPCRYGKKEIGKDPDHCIEYIKLEEYEWDAKQDEIAEMRECEHEYDDDDWEE